MSEPALLPATLDIDRERGIRLAQPVGFVSGIGLAVLYVVLAALSPLIVSDAAAFCFRLALAWLACEGLIWVGVLFARNRQGGVAAGFLVTGTQSSIILFQIVWASFHGLDAIFLMMGMAQLLPIGLSSLLDGSRLMFVTMGATIAVGAGLLFLLPQVIDPTFPLLERCGSWIILTVLAIATASLVYGSSTLYGQALEEMGTLRLAYERSQQLDELKDQFITHVNHELRTPIMTLQGTIEFLQSMHQKLPPEQLTLTYSQAQRSATRLVNLLSRVLDVQAIEQQSNTLEFEAVDVKKALEAAQDLVDPQQHRAINVRMSEKAIVWGEPQMVIQVLMNLLSNAIKYSSPETPISVVIRAVPEAKIRGQAPGPEKPSIEIMIKDRGLGIPPAQIPLLFHRFVRLPRDMASSTPGSGVGLYLCQTLVTAMGGSLRAESLGIPGEGSTFIIWLPQPPAESLAATAHQPKVTIAPPQAV